MAFRTRLLPSRLEIQINPAVKNIYYVVEETENGIIARLNSYSF